MKHYNPESAPDAQQWLAMDEHRRIELIESYHKQQRIKLPNTRAHTIIHTIVENQAAECLPAVVQALYRLQDSGLSRHDAIHAIGQVVAKHMFDLMRQESDDAGAFLDNYNQALDAL